MSKHSWFMRCGALLAALGVLLGAFGAHALKGELDEAAIAIWQTATRYHLIHALGLMVIALYMKQTPATLLRVAGWCMLLGVLLFSGSLYLLALGGPTWLGPITPFGGLLLIGSWLIVFVSTFKN